MRSLLVALTLSSQALLASAQSVPLNPVNVTAVGNTNRDCTRNARERALETAWNQALRTQGIAPQFKGCMRTVEHDRRLTLVEVNEVSNDVLGAKQCNATYNARISNRPQFVNVARDCTFIDRVIPVGVLLRSDLNGLPNNALAAELTSQLNNRLERANVRVISLTGLQAQFQNLKLIQECAVTGEEKDGNWADRCAKPLEDYPAARDAITAKMRDEFWQYPEDFETWESCGGLLILGEFSAASDDYDVTAQLQLDFQSAADWQAPVPVGTANSAKRPVSFGDVEGTSKSLLLNLTEAQATEAIQKVSRFINSNGCA